jgi:pilus assembly protein Flp/PilA
VQSSLDIKEGVMLYVYSLIQNLGAHRPFRSEDGVTAIEYGLIAALIAVVIITAVGILGNNIANVFNEVAGNVK